MLYVTSISCIVQLIICIYLCGVNLLLFLLISIILIYSNIFFAHIVPELQFTAGCAIMLEDTIILSNVCVQMSMPSVMNTSFTVSVKDTAHPTDTGIISIANNHRPINT